MTREDLTDIISDALGDSMDVDWNYSTGARYVIDALVKEGVITVADPDLLAALKRNRTALDLIDPTRPLQYATTMDLMRKDMSAAIAKAEAA